LNGTNTFTGPTDVNSGTVVVNGGLSPASAVWVSQAGSLAVSAAIGATTVYGSFAPGIGPGPVNASSMTFNSGSTYAVTINGSHAGSEYSQTVVASGPINLTGVTLNLSVGNGFTPAPGTKFDILVKNSSGPITGTFAGLPEGAAVFAGGQVFSISYLRGAGGHDVVLTAGPPGPPPTVENVQVNDGSAQRSEVRSIAVTFSGLVTFAGGDANAGAAFQLAHVQTGRYVYLNAAVSVDDQSRSVVTLTFFGPETDSASAMNGGAPSLADGRYTLDVFGYAVAGANGMTLAGDGTAPGSNYVSPADSYQGNGLHLYRLFGDSNGDGVVDPSDLNFLRSTLNVNNTQSGYLAFLDANNDGVVDPTDLNQFRTRFNTNVF
jgi:hypothetical protein